MDTPLQTCCKCRREFPATEEYWHKNKQTKNGLHGICRGCRSDIRKKYYRSLKDVENRNWNEIG